MLSGNWTALVLPAPGEHFCLRLALWGGRAGVFGSVPLRDALVVVVSMLSSARDCVVVGLGRA